jgi:succinate-semialdehyde dehydrogenase/glutarate-semialdehyde dehydrogenase
MENVSDTERDCTLLINGAHVSGNAKCITVLNKFSGTEIARVHVPDVSQVRSAVSSAHLAWRGGTPSGAERSAILERAAMLVEASSADFVQLMRLEAGFPDSDGGAEVNRCIQTLRLSATAARELSGHMVPLAGSPGHQGKLGFTLRVPLGVVLAVTPFNSPLNTVSHKVGPAFAAGNSVILKPSSETPLTAAKFADLLTQAGMPAGFLSVLYGGGGTVQALLQEEAIRYIAFTGSTETGRAIQAAAGLRRTQMELGSIAFTIVCADADLERALPKIVNAAFRKAGQVCTSIQVLLVHESLRGEVEPRLAAMTAAVPFGNPALPHTVTGPVINERATARITRTIDAAIQQGAVRLAGGAAVGNVIPPTLLTHVDDSMDVISREVFGPVMSLRYFDDLSQAISQVNGTPFGLAAGIFTNRLDSAFQALRGLDVGSVYVNETCSSRVDAMPYGGTKDSGFGREGPRYAADEMSEEKMITFSNVGL